MSNNENNPNKLKSNIINNFKDIKEINNKMENLPKTKASKENVIELGIIDSNNIL